MIKTKEYKEYNIDEETIRKMGLRQTATPVAAQVTPAARVFEYPLLENVFVMESDLYGNKMPEGFCFLVFNGTHGLIGKDVKVDMLKHASVEDIKRIVDSNGES
jgi:hypothetical protein